MLYITLLDQFHPGIYKSQVIDVCEHLNKSLNKKITLVAFLSIREIKTERPKIKAIYSNSIVLPAFPGLKNFEYTAIFLALYCLIKRPRTIICRNAFATTIALKVRKWKLIDTVIYDARSALHAEIKEYDVFPNDYLRNNIFDIENNATLFSDYRMAVSQQLVNYWKQHYNYASDKHVVINCTLNSEYTNFKIDENAIQFKRAELGFNKDDIILIYSGSTSPWQSFQLMYQSFKPFLLADKNIKFIFLSKKTNEIDNLINEFPNQISNYYVSESELLNYLQIGDYGVMIRQQSDTNKVAAPVKFPEYLLASLNVIVSENLGDYTEFVKANNCGLIFSESMKLLNTPFNTRLSNHYLAASNFNKNSEKIKTNYQKVLSKIIE